MALREFRDSAGTMWVVWDVPPRRVYDQIRAGADRRQIVTAGYAPERRTGASRRRRPTPTGLEYGWVCFESAVEKRRVAPPPAGWDALPDPELEVLCRGAAASPKSLSENLG
jgi:hypothetical protein